MEKLHRKHSRLFMLLLILMIICVSIPVPAQAASIKDIILGETEVPAENIRIFEVK